MEKKCSIIYIMTGIWVVWIYLFAKTVQLRSIHFNVCKFYLNNCKNKMRQGVKSS